MAFLLVRLSRIIPLLFIMAVLAGAIYLVVSYRQSPAHAKELLIKIFTWVSSILAVFFGIVSLYAVFEGNEPVFDLDITFAIVGVICLVITRLCNVRFLKNNPSYRYKPQKANVVRRWPWDRFRSKK